MQLTYKDRAKERLEGTDRTLSAPPAGFVQLPTDQYFEYAIVCADGRWQTGVGRVSDDGTRSLVFDQTYANSDGTPSNIMASYDFTANPADVFCTISSDTMNRVNNIVQRLGDAQILGSETSVASLGAENAVVEPVWPGHASCPVAYVEYEFNVFAWRGSQPATKAWKGTAIYSASAASVASTQVVLGSENSTLSLTAAIDVSSGFPVLLLGYTNADADLGFTFTAEVVATRINHPDSCW